MLYEIASFLLQMVGGLLTGACLLRLYMQQQRIPMSVRSGNPVGRFIFALTDWIVLPLRRVIPAIGSWDMASLVAAFLLQLAQFTVLWLLTGLGGNYVSVAVLAAFGLVHMAVSGMKMLVIVYAILSWVQTQSFLSDLLHRLVSPLLMPVRRVMPLVGGVDLSPLVLFALLWILELMLGNMQGAVLLQVASL